MRSWAEIGWPGSQNQAGVSKRLAKLESPSESPPTLPATNHSPQQHGALFFTVHGGVGEFGGSNEANPMGSCHTVGQTAQLRSCLNAGQAASLERPAEPSGCANCKRQEHRDETNLWQFTVASCCTGTPERPLPKIQLAKWCVKPVRPIQTADLNRDLLN